MISMVSSATFDQVSLHPGITACEDKLIEAGNPAARLMCLFCPHIAKSLLWAVLSFHVFPFTMISAVILWALMVNSSQQLIEHSDCWAWSVRQWNPHQSCIYNGNNNKASILHGLKLALLIFHLCNLWPGPLSSNVWEQAAANLWTLWAHIIANI